MVKFKFFVHCDGWINGGYENTHFAENEKEARKTIDEWNANGKVTLLEIKKISKQEFIEDYIPSF